MKQATKGLTFDSTPLRRAFLAMGLGYVKLASLAGCSLPTAHAVINGQRPTSRFTRRIAGVLGVNPADCWKLDVIIPSESKEPA